MTTVRFLPSLVIALFLSIDLLHAQAASPEAANQAAYEIFLTGDYEDAAAAYEKVLADFPTSTIVPAAQLQLAYASFFLGNFDAAQATVEKLLAGPPPPPAINEAARSLLPQILSAKASAIEPDDAARKTGFEAAVAKFTEFITQFPQSPEIEQSVYGRALANFQLEKFDESIKDLEENIARFGTSSTISQSRNLLALAFATKGSLELNKGEAANRETAFADYAKSTALLRSIIADRSDLTLINDAQFQLGEILFNQAAFSAEAERPALYDEALNAYRSVLPQAEVIALQEARLAAFPALRRDALRANDRAAIERLNQDNEREVRRLGALRTKPDQTTTAMIKMAEIFFNQNQPNAARVLISHLQPFLDTDDQKKRALYFTAMTYALQNAADRAVAAYDAFQAEYKGDPLASNLPLALGNVFLNSPDPAVNNPTTAAEYFEESLTIYPDGALAGLSTVSRAAALSRLGQAEEALKTFTDFLATNPRPEEGVIAQMGLAGIYKDTARWDEALAAYQEAITKFPTQPQVVDAEFWIAFATQQKGDNPAAIALFTTFITNHPDSPLLPTALYTLATAQLASNDKEAGLATLARIAEEFPASPPAPFTYFQRAQILGADGRKDEMLALMREFIAEYPQDEKVFFAYDSISQTALKEGDLPGAVAAYQEFVAASPTSPRAPEAILKIADLQRGQAEALGRFVAMPTDDQAIWKTHIDATISTSERLAAEYPDSPQVAAALRGLLAAQRLLVGAEIKQPADVEAYFTNLAESSDSAAVRSKAMFSLASYLTESDPARALETMQTAYDPSLVYAPADIDGYGLALIDNGKIEEAVAVYDKLAADFPLPTGAQAPVEIQEAQAIVLFGKGRAAQVQGDTAGAAQFFEQLKTLYPWSPKVLEANYGIAQALVEEQKYDEALALLTQIIRAPTATAELRANSMLLGGDIMVAKNDIEAAIDYYIKISQFYAGVPTAAAEGLWKGAQLLEKQADTLTDPAQKKRQLDQAIRAYRDLTTNYPNSEYAPEATTRLAALSPQ